MRTNLFLKTNLIVVLLILSSLFSAYTFGLNPVITLGIAVFGFLAVRKEYDISNNILFLALLVALLFLYIILPGLVYPTVHSDFYNHASISRILAETKTFDSLIHDYPRGTYALLGALIQLIPLNFFQTTTIVSVSLFLLSIITMYQLSFKLLKNEVRGIFATVLFAFFLATVWNLQLGFIPSVLGFYLLLNCLFYAGDENWLSILNGGALATVYPHYFIILCLYFLIKGFVNKKFWNSIKIIFLFLLVGGFEFFLSLLGVLVYHSDSAVLMKGGIFAPNIVMIFWIVILFIFTFKNFKFKDLFKEYNLLFFSIFVMQVFLSLAVLFNWFFGITGVVNLKQFYMIVKFFYLQMIPLSIFFSANINLRFRQIMIISLLLFAFFAGYLFYVNSNSYFNPAIFEIGDKISSLIPVNSTISLDPVLLNEVVINSPPFYYDSLIRLSEDYSVIIRINLEKSLRTPWMIFAGDSFYFGNTTVFRYDLSGEYYVGFNQSVAGEVIFQSGSLVVKKLI